MKKLIFIFLLLTSICKGQTIIVSDVSRKLECDTVHWIATQYDILSLTGGAVVWSDTTLKLATKYDIDTLYASFNAATGVQYSDSLTTFATPTQVHDSVKTKLDSSTVLWHAGYGQTGGDIVAGGTSGIDSAKFATVYDAFLKLDKADTATMLVPYLLSADTTGHWQPYGSYLTPTDTTSLSNRINTKLAISDTSYLHNQIITKLAITDTSLLHDQIVTKLAISDTSYLHNQIITKLNATDTASHWLSKRDTTGGGAYPYTSNPKGYLTGSDTLYNRDTTYSKSVSYLDAGTNTTVSASGGKRLKVNVANNGSMFYADSVLYHGSSNLTTVASSIALAGSPTTTTQARNDNSTKIATTAYVDSIHGYSIFMASNSAFSPANATTYYFGNTLSAGTTGSATWTVTSANAASQIPFTGTIIGVIYTEVVNTRVSTGGATYALVFNNITAGTTANLVTGIDHIATTSRITANNLNIAVIAGDSYNVKITTPTWTQTPQGLNNTITLIMK